MSGRSAYVRKEKTKEKDFTRPGGQSDGGNHNSEISTIRTNSSNGNDDAAYARVRKPHVPPLDVSGIEKSNFRTIMDRRSEGVRKGLTKVFGSKKKEADRPESSQNLRPESHELDAGEFPTHTSLAIRSQRHPISEPDYVRSAPSGKLPAPPPGPVFKRWVGNGRPPMAWSKLQKDPELYDPNADTQIFLSREIENKPPSMIVSSHIIEATGSRQLITLLRQGYIDEAEHFNGMPPSPANSPDFRPVFPMPAGRTRHPSPPTSDGSYAVDGHTSYKIYLSAPPGCKADEAARWQVTTRNVFGLLYGVSLCGFDMFQALSDLRARLELWMPDDADPGGMIVDYMHNKNLDDVRNNPAAAAALLAFFEHPAVQNTEGWREAYIHACGMYSQVIQFRTEYLHISPITRAILERGSLDIELKVDACERAFEHFDFDYVWAANGLKTNAHPDSVGRSAFNRLRAFLVNHYKNHYRAWPLAAKSQQDQWLTRTIAKELATDFAALYDYLVNRDVVWDSSEERSGRKWHIVHPGRRFEPDSEDFPFTDMLVAFDNERRFPHIPCPYPLVPEETNFTSRDVVSKANRKGAKPTDERVDKMAEKKAALAYTESTNIYLLGPQFVHNDLVDAFVRFEKEDQPAVHDPYSARRGRWVLIYCILQYLATISVDTPDLKYTRDVDYYLNPKLGPNMPPWEGTEESFPEATHTLSHCWTVRKKWQAVPMASARRPQPLTGLSALSERGNGRSGAPSIASSDAGSSMRSPTLTNVSLKSKRSNRNFPRQYDGASYTGYAPGIEKVDDWPTRDQSHRYYEERSPKSSSMEPSRNRKPESSRNRHSQQAQQPQPLMGEFVIKDFDAWPEDDWTGGDM